MPGTEEQQKLARYINQFVEFTARPGLMKYKKIILLFSMGCSHCMSVFKYFMRKPDKSTGQEGLDMDIAEYKKFMRVFNKTKNFKKSYNEYVKTTRNPISIDGIRNIETIALFLLPVEASTKAGNALAKEAYAFAKIDIVYDTIRFPSWIDFKTHEVYDAGHHSKMQILDLLDEKKLDSRRSRFKNYYSGVTQTSCDAVACGMKARVKKIDPKDTKLNA